MIFRPNPPIQPPLGGQYAKTASAIAAPADDCCTILDSCDQCGRRLFRPHVANGRAFCGECCPTCAAESVFDGLTARSRGRR